MCKKSTLIIGVLLVMVCNTAMAQADTTVLYRGIFKRLNAEISLGFGIREVAIGGACSMIFKEGWGISPLLYINVYRSTARPRDYRPYHGMLFTGVKYPKDVATVFAVPIVKEWAIKDKKTRLYVAGGPSLVTTSFYSFIFNPDADESTSNYGRYSHTNSTVGLVAKAGISFMYKHNAGMQVGFTSSINNKHWYNAFEWDVILGKLWYQPKQPRQPRQPRSRPARSKSL